MCPLFSGFTLNLYLSRFSLSLSPQRVVPEVSERVRQQLRKIQSSFPDILSQFMESSTSIPSLAVPPPMMTTAPVTTPAKGQERASAGGSGGVEERESATPTDTYVYITVNICIVTM